MTCISYAEREAWLEALRGARTLSAHRLYKSEVAKERAEVARDAARDEKDDARTQAEILREEANANEAAAQRARTQLEGLVAGQRQTEAALAARDDELKERVRAEKEMRDARDKLQGQLKRAEEQSSRLLAERDRAEAAKSDLVEQLAEAKRAATDSAGRAGHAAELAQRLQAMEKELEVAREEARRGAQQPSVTPSSSLGAVGIGQVAAVGGGGGGGGGEGEAALEIERRRIAEEHQALQQRRAAREAAKQLDSSPRTSLLPARDVYSPSQRNSVGGDTEPRASATGEAASPQLEWLRKQEEQPAVTEPAVTGLDADESVGKSPGRWRSSIAMPRLSLPQPRKSLVNGRRKSLVTNPNGGEAPNGQPPSKPPPPPPAAPPPPPRHSSSAPAGDAPAATSDIDLLRQQLEDEQAALRQKRVEREARRLRRQLELAEASGSLPAEPPPQVAPPVLQQRGRQMSNLI